ncbi:ATPase AAA [Alphaproteobacteria bacterium]|nr:ATPase AAA [Alphaproteobacteria bacterium]
MDSKATPLAERMRPKTLDDVVGQDKAMVLLRQIVAKREPTSLIFWGPPGTGKTTLARIIAHETEADFIEMSAVTSGKKDIERIVEHARQNWNLGLRTILFVDEIHRFNKAQQDAFLPHVESGLITLIGATTENPSFEVITPLLSRSRVVVLENLASSELAKIIDRSVKELKIEKKITSDSVKFLAEIASGDARVALGTLEVALGLLKPRQKITPKLIEIAAGKKLPGYDKKGDMHYDVISAFIKSMRGGDDQAALYYLARMVAAGEDPKFIARRMVIFASEDIGLAGNGALGLALNAFMAVERIGMPESGIILSHVVVALARAKKSRESCDMWFDSIKLSEKFPDAPVPLHIRNAETKLMKDLGYMKDYKWKAGFQHEKGFLPENVTKHLQK